MLSGFYRVSADILYYHYMPLDFDIVSYFILLGKEGGVEVMDQIVTISQLSKEFGISTRMLRHYEKMGLLSSQRIDGYVYRVYDK